MGTDRSVSTEDNSIGLPLPSPLDSDSIGRGHANTKPIRVTFPHLVKGTSAIRSLLLSGRQHFRTTVWWPQMSIHGQSSANPSSVWCQPRVNPLPILFQLISNPFPMQCQYNTNLRSIHEQWTTHSSTATNPVSIWCQFKANWGPI